MSNRRVVGLERMFRRIATAEEIRMVDRLYIEGRKGPAIRKMVDRISVVFNQLLDEKQAGHHVTSPGFEEIGVNLVKPLL